MNFEIGLSALRSSQFAVNTISHNLANASTEGFHRQEVGFETRQTQVSGNFPIGSGVEINSVRRIRDQVVESAYTNSISDLSDIGQRLSIETRIESFFLPGEGSLQDSLTGFFDELSRLSANPGETVLRNSVVTQGADLARGIQSISNGLVELRESVERQLDLEITTLNGNLQTLVDLQNEISTLQHTTVPNNLLDQRDQLVNSIADQIDIQRFESGSDNLSLGLAGSSISIGLAAIQFESVKTDDGLLQVQLVDGDREIQFTGGRIAALTDSHNNVIGEFQEKIEALAEQVIQQVDQAHAIGLGLEGSFSIQRSTRAVADVDANLGEAGTAFPVDAGELFISITSPEGLQKTASITIDPETDSLRDVAAKISDLDNIQAVVDEASGQLTVIASPGFQFDFTGALETGPDLSGISGTSLPSIDGSYIGESNQRLTIQTVGSGTVGRTPGLTAQVIDSGGRVLEEINIGEGYEPGSSIDLLDGVTISYGAGEVVDSESFTTSLVSNPDSTGILSALGFNTFFQGSNATDIAVNQVIVDNPDAIATSRSGEVGDTRNLEGLISLRDEQVLGNGRLSFSDFIDETNSEIGFRVQSSTSIEISVSELNFQFRSERDSVSGVDVNEELINLTQHQNSFEAATQVLRTIEAMLDELFRIIR